MDLDLPESLSSGRRRLIAGATARMASEYDDDFLGLILSGSAGRGLDTDRSDLDLLVILTPQVADGPRAPRLHTAGLELIPLSLDHLETVADFGHPQYGYRWSYAWAPTVLDRTGGRISAAVERQTGLAHAETMSILVAHDRLDGWINLVYRALKSDRDGNAFEAGLDGSESIPLFLDVVFALEGLVRPYNKYLRWALQQHPLTAWPSDKVLSLLPRLGAGEPTAMRYALERVRQISSEFGDADDREALRAVFDGWSPDEYAILRSGS
ncbi:hypothetical protein JOF29_008384 [Kribbella aluminosa]|uniref:Nucleotidyltransferase domain-containing protein n=1 Tax=Kribbella aluminosa TaxID=416017 RepID=A0ABS4V047_9ACTN|nr:hypothetical protein [Kribbella aluminosa]MBP2357274.1 hypothetical protein [Kribbella aluminosa]